MYFLCLFLCLFLLPASSSLMCPCLGSVLFHTDTKKDSTRPCDCSESCQGRQSEIQSVSSEFHSFIAFHSQDVFYFRRKLTLAKSFFCFPDFSLLHSFVFFVLCETSLSLSQLQFLFPFSLLFTPSRRRRRHDNTHKKFGSQNQQQSFHRHKRETSKGLKEDMKKRKKKSSKERRKRLH